MGEGPQDSMNSRRKVVRIAKKKEGRVFYKHDLESIFVAQKGRYPLNDKEFKDWAETYDKPKRRVKRS